jgi:hypothetical protein
VANHNRGQDKSGGGGNPTAAEKKYIALSIHSLNSTYKAAKDEEGKRGETNLKYTSWTAIAATIYTAITFVLLAAGIWSAIQATKAVAIASDSESRQFRAYVGVVPGDIENFGIPGKEKSIIIRKNYGQTPAYDVGFSGNFIKVDKKEINVGIIANCVNPKIGGMITMFPSATLPFNVVVSDSRPPDVINAVHRGDFVITTYGTLCYHDAFGVSHYTNYCWRYSGEDLTAKNAEGCLLANDSN